MTALLQKSVDLSGKFHPQFMLSLEWIYQRYKPNHLIILYLHFDDINKPPFFSQVLSKVPGAK